MWICPKCQQKFVNRNQSHSCGHYTVGQFLRGKDAGGIALFRYFLTQYRKIGSFELHPVKTRIALVRQMRFCAVNKIGADFIDVHFVLTQPSTSPCFRKIDNLGNRFFIHHLRIRQKSNITKEVRTFMQRAYRIGKREHVHVKNN